MLTGSPTLSPPRGFRAIFLDRSPHHRGARRMTCQPGYPFGMVGTSSQQGQLFSKRRHCGPPSGVNPVKSGQSEHARAVLALSARAKGSTCFLVQTPAKDELGWEVDPSAWNRFSPYKRGLIKTIKLYCRDKSVCYGESCFPACFRLSRTAGGIAA